MDILSLYTAPKNTKYMVVDVPDVGLLNSLGLRAGTKVTVQNRYALGGPVLLRVEDAYSVAIGKDIAKQIGVTAC
ncbi:MAG: ferrous iron transport protein A [Oscillospiraceae bacterium]|nr:ferrous iron transport protein A [Oscillospiraceae bacterium]